MSGLDMTIHNTIKSIPKSLFKNIIIDVYFEFLQFYDLIGVYHYFWPFTYRKLCHENHAYSSWKNYSALFARGNK